MPIYAGAAGCNVTNKQPVGYATVNYSGGTVTVAYSISAGYVMNEAHVYVGCAKYPTINGKPTVAPGQYTFNANKLDRVSDLTVSFTGISGPTYVIVHAVTCQEVCHCGSFVPGNETFGPIALSTSPCSASSVTAKGSGKKDATITSGLEAKPLKVYPNPFNEKVTFEFVSNKDTQVVLEITNVVGQKITTLFNGPVRAGELNRIEYSPVNVVPGVLIYQLIMDGSIQNGRVVYQK